MKCERAQEWFSSYIDGSLGPAQTVVLETHLSGCPACQGAVDGLRNVWTGLEAMPTVDAPTSLRARIWQRIQATEDSAARSTTASVRSTGRQPLWARIALAGAAAVLVLAAAQVTVPGRYRTAGLDWLLSRPTRSGQASAALRAERAPDSGGVWAAHITFFAPGRYSGLATVSLNDARTGEPLAEAGVRVVAGRLDAVVSATKPVAPGSQVRVTVRPASERPAFAETTLIVR